MEVLREKVIEDLVATFPHELLGEPLTLIERQMKLGSKRPDLLFRDTEGRYVIAEVKRGEITREALGQLGEYLGMIKLKWRDQPFRFMVIGTYIPPERKVYFEAIGAEVVVLQTKSLSEFAIQKGIDPEVGILKREPEVSVPSESASRPSLDLLGVVDENSFFENLRAQPNSAAGEHVMAVYAMLKSFPGCTLRFKKQGRTIFTLSAQGRQSDIAYVGLNRKYSTGVPGQYGFEVVILWRNIVTIWGESVARAFKDVLIRVVKPEKVNDIMSSAHNQGVYVGINVAKELASEDRFRMFFTGFRDFIKELTSS